MRHEARAHTRYITGAAALALIAAAALAFTAGTAQAATHPVASVHCSSIGYPVYICTGTVSGGAAPYTPYWGWKGTWNEWPPGAGPTFSIQMVCKDTTADWVLFKACDSFLQCSNVARAWCGPGIQIDD